MRILDRLVELFRPTPVAEGNWSPTASLDASSARRQRRVRRELAGALKRYASSDLDDPSAPRVQLIVQSCPPEHYVQWRRDWQKAWRRHGGQWSTDVWPEQLDRQHAAQLVLAVPAGRLPSKFPKARVVPTFSPEAAAPHDELCALVLVAQFVCNPGNGVIPLFAPPIIELIGAGQTRRRHVEDFGLDWPLPPAL